MSDEIKDVWSMTPDERQEIADDMALSHDNKWTLDKLREGNIRDAYAMIAANIAEDRYNAGSAAALYAIRIMLRHGLQAALDFADDLEHHES